MISMRISKIHPTSDFISKGTVQIETEPGKLATKVVFDVASTGEHYELEATTIGGSGINDAFVAAIA